MFSTLPTLGQFFIVYLTGSFLTRILPETLTFFLISTALLKNNSFELSTIFETLTPIIIIFYSFFLGLNFPWHQANLFRKKLYRNTLTSFLLIIGLSVLLYYFLVTNKFLFGFADNFSTIIFYFIPALLTVSFLDIYKTTIHKKTNGPLTGMSTGTALLFNILVLFLLPVISQQLTLPSLIYSLCGALIAALTIKLLGIFVYPQKQLSWQITTLLLLALSIYFIKELNIFIFPVLTGLLLSLKKNGRTQQLVPTEMINIFKNIIIIAALPYLQYTPATIWLTAGYFIYKQLIFRLVFFILGKNLHLSESVYPTLGSALATQSLFFIPFVIYLNNLHLLEKNIYLPIISVIVIASVIENTLHYFVFTRNLKKAGEF